MTNNNSNGNKNNPNTSGSLLVLKSTMKTSNIIISSGTYASNIRPKQDYDRFIMLGETDALGLRVLFIGKIKSISAITSSSSVHNVFDKDQISNWNYQYDLYDILDLRDKALTIEDVFLSSNLKTVKYTTQFTYVPDVITSFKALLNTLNYTW